MEAPSYRKVGRGGAGNYYIPDNSTTKSEVRDLEAQVSTSSQRPRANSNTSTFSVNSIRRSSDQSTYLSSGRGGAGNVVPINPPAQTSTILPVTSTSPPPPTSVGSPPTLPRMNSDQQRSNRQSVQQTPPSFTGRGGAGNLYAMQEYRKQQEEKRKVEQERKWKEAEKDVELGLMKPSAARLERERVE